MILVASPGVRARLAYVALYAAIGALFPYMPIYYRSRGLDLGSVGLVAAVFSAAGMVGSPLWGAAADRFGRSRVVLLVPASLAALAFALLAFANGLGAIAGAAAAASFAMSGVSPVLDARALETIPDDRSPLGRLRGCGSISFIARDLFVGWLTDQTAIRTLLPVLVGPRLRAGIIGVGLR